MASTRCLLSTLSLLVCVAYPAYGTSWEKLSVDAANAQRDCELAQALKLYEAALEKAKGFKPDDPRYTISLHNLATLYVIKAQYATAEKLFKQEAQAYAKRYGEDWCELLEVYFCLGKVTMHQSKFRESEAMYERALSIYHKRPDGSRPNEADIFLDLFIIYLAEGKTDLARKTCDAAVRNMRGSRLQILSLLDERANGLRALGNQARNVADKADQSAMKVKSANEGNNPKLVDRSLERAFFAAAELLSQKSLQLKQRV